MTMEEKLTREQDLSSLVERVNRGGLKIKTPKPKGTWGGARKGAGAKKGRPRPEGAGRKPSGKKMTYLMIRIDISLESRIKAEAERQGVSRSELIRRWAATLPESTEEKTQAMHDAYMIKKAMKEL